MYLDLSDDMADMKHQTQDLPVLKINKYGVHAGDDSVAIEEPLEIGLTCHLDGALRSEIISVTMRTPGDDSELALGYLFSEGIIDGMQQVETVSQSRDNRVEVTLLSPHSPDVTRLRRNSYMSSSCGVCGKASIEALQTIGAQRLPADNARVAGAMLRKLPAMLSAAQSVFERTGGLHAAALFDFAGDLLVVREDVGRHNALDKLVGVSLREGTIPLRGRILLLSGRISFELVQKALRARCPVVVAIGAPSSLAIQLAVEYNLTTVGFLRDDRFNVYSGEDRIET